MLMQVLKNKDVDSTSDELISSANTGYSNWTLGELVCYSRRYAY
ncbi:MAG: hypothetical protein ACI8SJ_000383 [Shewanella sp.]|jgi:hypothetical protein